MAALFACPPFNANHNAPTETTAMYFAPRDSDMLRYRREVLGLSDWPLPIALTASGNIDTSAAILTSGPCLSCDHMVAQCF